MKPIQLIVMAMLVGGCAVRPPMKPTSPPSDLGSPPEVLAEFSTDYRVLVAAALPRVTADELRRRLNRVRTEAAETKPLAIRDAAAWAGLFERKVDPLLLEHATELVDTDDASYLVDPEIGRFYVSIRYPDLAPVPRQKFEQLIPDIRRAHEVLAEEKIGISRHEIFFVDFRETLVQSTPRPGLAGAREGPIECAGATTTLLRAVGGILVDGSFARISSVDARRVEMADVRWPPLRMAPEVEDRTVVAPARLADRVVERISSTAQGKPVNVLMAVVLRPMRADHRIYFVPSLRVGISPKSEPGKDGYQTEAGEEVYFDLVAGMEELADRDEREPKENLERQSGQPAWR